MSKDDSGTRKNPLRYFYSNTAILSTFLIGLYIRYWLLFSRYQTIIANHIEVSTPLNSWKRVLEGLHLQSQGIDPYKGDLIHEAPLTMVLYRSLTPHLGSEYIFLIFDAATAVMLYLMAKQYMFQLFVNQELIKNVCTEDNKEFLLVGADFENSPVFVVAAFLFNPYTILNCVGLSTTVLHNFFLAFFLYSMLKGSVLLSSFSLAVCAMISLYPVTLVVPLALCFYNTYRNKLWSVLSVVLFFVILGGLQYTCFILSGGYDYLSNVYGFIVTVPDLKPNIGLFWYFFTEMFDHFRELFIYSFQINATILYLVPLAIKFRNDPFLLSVAILSLSAIFKSYPCLGDVGFAMSLLPSFIHLFNYSQQGFLVGVIFLISSALGPILWHLWIYSNSANANFYFGVTLAFAIAQIFLVTDVLFAYLKREFNLKYGRYRKLNGVEALLILE